MASKTALSNILKVASNQCICSKDWWELWIVGRDCKKHKRSKQWGVKWSWQIFQEHMMTLVRPKIKAWQNIQHFLPCLTACATPIARILSARSRIMPIFGHFMSGWKRYPFKDLCMTNSSKVLIYLTLLYFIFYCTLVSNAKGNMYSKVKLIRTLKPFVIQRSTLPFRG